MSETENRSRESLSPDTKVKLSLRLLVWVVIVIAINAFAVGGAYFNFNNKLETLQQQQSAFIEAQNKTNDSIRIELSADERIITADENNHALFAQMVDSRLNIKQ